MLSCNITAFLNHTHVILQEICSRVNDALRRKAQLSQHPRSQSAHAAEISAPDHSFSAGPDAGRAVRRPGCGLSSDASRKVAIAVAYSPSRLHRLFQAGGGQEVRWPDFRALFAQIEPEPLGALQLHQQRQGDNLAEQIRPSLEEWQLQQLASQDKHLHEDNQRVKQQLPCALCGSTRLWATFDTNADGGISREDWFWWGDLH